MIYNADFLDVVRTLPTGIAFDAWVDEITANEEEEAAEALHVALEAIAELTELTALSAPSAPPKPPKPPCHWCVLVWNVTWRRSLDIKNAHVHLLH
jgi:hypothetical protein